MILTPQLRMRAFKFKDRKEELDEKKEKMLLMQVSDPDLHPTVLPLFKVASKGGVGKLPSSLLYCGIEKRK
jgi:hypothetical protein